MKLFPHITVTCLLLLFGVSAFSSPFSFGRMSASDMDLEYYRNKYPDAPAVVLGDIADSKFVYNNSTRRFQFQLFRQTRIMILTEAGLNYGDVPIRYYQSPDGREEIKKFRGHVYNLEGTRVNRTRVNYREAYNNDLGNNWREIIFAFPSVKVGTVVELRYEITSDYLFNMRSWLFQREIPVEYSEYQVNLPSFFNYMARFQGNFELAVNEEKKSVETFRYTQQVSNYGQKIEGRTFSIRANSTQFRWVAKDLPALIREPFTDNIYNYLGMIFFEMVSEQFPEMDPVNYTTTWNDVSRHYLRRKDFGEFLKLAETSSRHFIPSQEFNTPRETIDWALNEVSSQITWNGNASRYANQTPTQVIDRGVGNSAEINLMLVALLRNLNLQAYPVVVSTVDNGSLFSDSPTITQWNYVVVQVRIPGEQPILLDATASRPVAGYLPQRAINGRGRIIDPDINHWIDLESNINNRENKEYNLDLDELGNLWGTVTIRWEDYGAYLKMQELANRGEEELKKTITRRTGVTLTNMEVQTLQDDTLAVIVQAQISAPNFAQIIGNEMLIPALLFETLEENPLKSEQRYFPVKLPYNSNSTTTFNIRVPDGFSTSHLPGRKAASFHRFAHEFVFNKEDQILTIKASTRIGSRTVNPNQYSGFMAYMDRLVVDNSDNIILKTD